MNWTEITINTTPQAAEAVCGILYELGVGGVSIEDPTLLNEQNRTTVSWDVLDQEVIDRYSIDKAIIKAYFSDLENMEDIIIRIKEGLSVVSEYFDIGEGGVSLRVVNEEDWANNWKKYYKPLEIGKRIIVKPLWEDLPSDNKRDIIIELDPGMAFGTGTHETTQLCLIQLEKLIKKDMDILDIGCGSGILSIGAVLLGAKSTLAVDIDENAVKAAIENASNNGLYTDKITVLSGNILEDGAAKDQIASKKYDIIVANIIADVIVVLCNDIKKYLKPGGIFICSGIIDHRVTDVENALAQNGFTVKDELSANDWSVIVAD